MNTPNQTLWSSIHGLLDHPLLFHTKQQIATSKYRSFKASFSPFVKFGEIQGKNILDVGCGTGLCSHHLFSENANQIFGIDISYEYVLWAKRLYPHNHFACGGADHMPFPPNTFDFILLSSILHHLPDHVAQSLFKGIISSCRPDAHIIISEPIWSDDKISNFLLRHDRGQFVKNSEGYLELIKDYFKPKHQFVFKYARTNFLGIVAGLSS